MIFRPSPGRGFKVPGKEGKVIVLNPCEPFVMARPKKDDDRFWVLRSGPFIGIFQNSGYVP